MITDTLLEKAARSGDGDEYLMDWLHAARHPDDPDAMEFVRGQDALVDTGTWPWLAQRIMILAGVSLHSIIAATPPSTHSAQTLIRLFNQYNIDTADALFYTIHVASNTS